MQNSKIILLVGYASITRRLFSSYHQRSSEEIEAIHGAVSRPTPNTNLLCKIPKAPLKSIIFSLLSARDDHILAREDHDLHVVADRSTDLDFSQLYTEERELRRYYQTCSMSPSARNNSLQNWAVALSRLLISSSWQNFRDQTGALLSMNWRGLKIVNFKGWYFGEGRSLEIGAALFSNELNPL